MLITLTRIAARSLFLVGLLCSVCAGQSKSSTTEVRVIPQPRQLTKTTDVFHVTKQTRLVLADGHSEDDRFAAQDFSDDLKETAGVQIRIGGGRGRQTILIGDLKNASIQASLKRAGLSVPDGLSEEGYVLAVTSTEMTVGGASPAGVFYGLQTLKQLVAGENETTFVPGVRIVDWPAMRWRAVSDDISRRPLPT